MKNQVHQLSRAIEQLAHQQKLSRSSLANTRVSSLRKRVIRLSRRLRAYASQSTVKTLLALATVVLAGSGTDVLAQQFAAPIENPFGLEVDPTQSDEDLLIPSFGDIDGDGDLDMFSVSYEGNELIFQENIGSASDPAFGSRQLNPFGIVMPNDAYYALPTLADVDNDGDLDLLSMFNLIRTDSLGSGNDGDISILFSENEGTVTAPAFGDTTRIVVEDFDENFLSVKLVDIDGDGDLDVVGSGYDLGDFTFAKNDALPGALPSFGSTQVNPFGLSQIADGYEIASFGDLDNDGDLDILSHASTYDINGDATASFVFRENVGNGNSPQFSAPEFAPFGLAANNDEYVAVPTLVDIDGDGDLDLMLFTYNDESEEYKLKYFENTIAVSTREILTTSVDIFPNPASSQMTIQTSGVIEQLSVIDVLGVSHNLEVRGNNQVEISHLPNGTYTVFATQSDGVRLQAKLLKQ